MTWRGFSQKVVDYAVGRLLGHSVSKATFRAGFASSRGTHCAKVEDRARELLMESDEELERMASVRDLTEEERIDGYAAMAVLGYRRECNEGK